MQFNRKSNALLFWTRVASIKNIIGENLFEDLVNLVLKVLTLPHARLFSKINLIKTKLQNKMHINKLNVVFTIKYRLRIDIF